MFVHDDRLVRRLHERRVDDLRRDAHVQRIHRHQRLPADRRSLRRSVGRSMVRLGSRLAADPTMTPVRPR
jgi:hypothetical protein